MEWFETKALPRCGLPKNPVTKLDQLQDRVLAKNLAGGHAVDAWDLLVREGSSPMYVPKASRACTIKVLHSDCLAFQAEKRICVQCTMTSSSRDEEYTRIILENVLLLATDPVDISKGWAGSGPRASTVTRGVTPEEAQTLILAHQLGTLRLVPPKMTSQKSTPPRPNGSAER
jgi:Flp pilus assembly protein CpaB